MRNSQRFAISQALKDRPRLQPKRNSKAKKVASTRQVTVRLNENELALLDILAAKESITPAHFLRQSIVRTCLREHQGDNELMDLITTGGAR
jgi:hypothetical protein